MRLVILLLLGIGGHVCLAETPPLLTQPLLTQPLLTQPLLTQPLLTQLTSEGITVAPGVVYVLPAPSLTAGQDAAARKAILDDFAGGRGWKSFSRKSVVAPVSIDVEYIKDASDARIGHSAHSAFIVHAPLETLKDEELMKQVFGQPEDSEEAEEFQVQQLTAAELAPLGITLAGDHESYGAIQMPLLSRVIVRGVIRSQRIVTDDSVTITWVMDDRFSETSPPQNTWAAIERNDVGKKKEGDPQVYSGASGYLSVSRLPEIKGASFVESHLVLHEPQDWFRGSNVLRSKLPILMQESARSFRRKLMDR